jgi:hypothetical protein
MGGNAVPQEDDDAGRAGTIKFLSRMTSTIISLKRLRTLEVAAPEG